ncbi:MAG TPA: hypothetical protein VFU36_08770 [Jatrophihabitans sp.]|nr:hypothetical protein [Jatrophihabitans sp.]
MKAPRTPWQLGLLSLLLMGCTSQGDSTTPTPPSLSRPSSSATQPPPVTPTAQGPTLAPVPLRKYCHSGDPLIGVYSPWRLTVKSPCAAVTGVVAATDIEHDGDLHISLADVDPKYLNAVNLSRAHQDLVVEAVPGIPMPTPPVGSHITVIGPWVLDTQTGWLEVHPVWRILPAG